MLAVSPLDRRIWQVHRKDDRSVAFTNTIPTSRYFPHPCFADLFSSSLAVTIWQIRPLYKNASYDSFLRCYKIHKIKKEIMTASQSGLEPEDIIQCQRHLCRTC